MDWEPILRLLVAAGLAAVIGIDRELRSKPAGLRTNIVVAVAAAAFAYTGQIVFDGGDPTRVASQVVSGIGFLGGGAIFAAGGKPHGLTTAAALWGSAAIGIAAGVGAMTVAVAVVGVTIVALWPLDWFASSFLQRLGRQDVHLQVFLDGLPQLGELERMTRAREVRILELHPREFKHGVLIDMIVSGRPRQVSPLLADLEEHPELWFVSDASLSVHP